MLCTSSILYAIDVKLMKSRDEAAERAAEERAGQPPPPSESPVTALRDLLGCGAALRYEKEMLGYQILFDADPFVLLLMSCDTARRVRVNKAPPDDAAAEAALLWDKTCKSMNGDPAKAAVKLAKALWLVHE